VCLAPGYTDTGHMRLTDVVVPDSQAARTALEVVTHYSPPALVNHCQRSYVFAAALASTEGIEIDHELLYVATMLHDLALEPAFDNVSMPFEEAGGHLAWIFTAGLGWEVERRDHAALIVVDHMQDDTDVSVDPEGLLLARATSLDISGSDPGAWSTELIAGTVLAFPRLDLAERFTACFADQAERKPDSQAARAIRSGIADRMQSNPLNSL